MNRQTSIVFRYILSVINIKITIIIATPTTLCCLFRNSSFTFNFFILSPLSTKKNNCCSIQFKNLGSNQERSFYFNLTTNNSRILFK